MLGFFPKEQKLINKLTLFKANLTAPTLTAGVTGGRVTLNVSEIKKNINANIYYWKEGVEQQVCTFVTIVTQHQVKFF